MSVMESARLGGTVTTFDQANFSTSKQRFSFGKEQRFQSPRKLATDVVSYDLPSTIKKKTCSFGIG
jgi:hypothetical protein